MQGPGNFSIWLINLPRSISCPLPQDCLGGGWDHLWAWERLVSFTQSTEQSSQVPSGRVLAASILSPSPNPEIWTGVLGQVGQWRFIDNHKAEVSGESDTEKRLP